tara:strand:+ start:109 stop:651 length:543 start_codon:yes stop_codon:yes gene_type:complete
MATKTKTKTKNKLSKALKNTFISELKDKKEEERLERIKTNSDLKEVIIYTNKNQPHNKQFTDLLTKEGIKFDEIDVEENKDEWNKVLSITNLPQLPTALINKNFLVQRRDFQNPQQLMGAIQHFANPNFENPSFEGQVLENMKTTNYNLMMRINQLSQQIAPMITFVQNLEKQLAEEDSE